MLTIDGSYGEGGGQVLRTCLSLSAITDTPIRLTNIRAGRGKPGLAAQHLTCVRAAAKVCDARVEGDSFGSQELVFQPGAPRCGEFTLDVADVRPSAGSVNLILQTVLPVLARCDGPSRVTLRGGTHVAWAPTFEYVAEVFLPAASRMGVDADVQLNKAGYYPRGGGEEILTVRPSARWTGADLSRPEADLACRLVSRTTKLPDHVGHRQMSNMTQAFPEAEQTSLDTPGIAPGTSALAATVPGQGGWAGCTAIGQRGKPAEKVGREAVAALGAFVDSRAAVDQHLADQLLLYAALAEGTTRLTVEAVTEHARTNVWVIEQFLGPTFTIEDTANEPPRIIATPVRD
ncbi:MAG TPA: RNA 3'-terminal phosphate cyclase [Armatimonadota bacterium]|nr:RNA 3'-terminal phosphate cyclase [Armatimonadota bacterium]